MSSWAVSAAAAGLPDTSLPRAPRTRAAALTIVILSMCAASAAARDPQPPEQPPQPPRAQDAPTEFVVLEGQITDNAGRGHAGVTVTVRRKMEDGTEGDVLATTTTDKLGDFVVTAAKPVRGNVVVRFSKRHYAELTRELRVGEDDLPPFIGEVLHGKLVVIGRVIDGATERPVGGASVTLQAEYKSWDAKTNDRGEFTIKGVLPGKGLLIVEADGYGREQQGVGRLEDFGEIIVAIKPERIVHIKLVDDSAEPVAGATVELYDERHDDLRVTVTDSNGSATVRGLRFDATVLSARLTHEDYVSGRDFSRRIAVPADQRASTHRLVMLRAGRISGLITDADTGAPLYGARVVSGEEYSDASPRDWTDYRGRYTIGGIKPGPAVVTVHLSGFAPELLTVDVAAGKTAELNVELRRGALLRGIVKNDDGAPVPEAYIEAIAWRGYKTLGLRAMSDKDGRFVIEDAPHDEFEIAVTALSRRSGMAGPAIRPTAPVKKTVKAGGDKTVEIVLPDAPADRGPLASDRFRIGDTAPVLKMTTVTGESLDFADLKGKTILLDFWATWCAPCIAEIPVLQELDDKFRTRKDFVIISVSLDGDEKALRSFLRKRKMDWHHVFGEEGGAQKAADRYAVTALPAVFLIDPDGRLVAIDLHGADLAKKVERLLKDTDPT